MIKKRAFFIILYILSFKLFAQKIHYLLPENKYIFEEQTVYNFDELPAEEQGEKNRKKLTVAYNFGDYFSTHYLNVIREENYFFHTIEVTDSNQKRYIVLIDDLIRENINQELHNKINGIWVVSYIFDILKSNSFNTLLEYEPFWQTEWKTSVGEDWKDDYFPSYIIITDNYIYISSYATGYRFYLIQNDMKNNRCKCYSKDKFVHGQVSAKNDFLTKLEGKEKEDVIKFINSRKDLKFVKEDPTAQKILEGYKKEKNELGKKEIGNITEEIPGGSANRIPNEKNPEGSLATTLVSEAVLHMLKNMGTGNVDMVIMNSGGTRISLVPGKISYDDAYTLLPFTSNTIYILKMNGAEIKQVIEDALHFSLDGGSSGAFPYGAGIRFEATKEGTHGTRVKKVEVLDAKTNKWVPIDETKTYTVGTNSYVAAGKDGYTTFGKITSTPGREGVNTHLGVETSFINYVKEKKAVGRPESSNVKFKF